MPDNTSVLSNGVSRIICVTADWVRSMPGGYYEKTLRCVLPLGLFWLFAGLAVMPAGDSLSPSHAYSYILLPTLGLPALLLMVRRPWSLIDLLAKPVIKWVCILLIWAGASLIWADTSHVTDWIGRIIGIFLFLYACQEFVRGQKTRVHYLVISWAVVISIAVFAAVIFSSSSSLNGGSRLMGVGVLGNPIPAAAASSVVILWFWSLHFYLLWQRVLRVVFTAGLLAFVVMTYSRGAWGALYCGVIALILSCHPKKEKYFLLTLLIALAVLAAFLLAPELSARGWSKRPQITLQAIGMVGQHPWFGIGLGSPIHPVVDGIKYWHTHNLFTELAVLLGIPGLVVWLFIWFMVAWYGWRYRYCSLGRLALATWVFGTIQAQVGLPHLIDSPRVEWMVAWFPIAICSLIGTNR